MGVRTVNLGRALKILGERESWSLSMKNRLRSFVKLCRRERATNTTRLGGNADADGQALLAFGGRHGDAAMVGEAVEAFRSALEERKRTRAPLDWAETMSHLGTALFRREEFEGEREGIEEAIVVFRAALEETPRERVPLDWAATQNDLGIALEHRRAGERDGAG